jgi:olefin beta-lactone synthetase
MSESVNSVNIANRLSRMAARFPHRRAVVAPGGRDRSGRVAYSQLTFAQLEEETDRLAAGLVDRAGLRSGMKLVLFVPFSIEFISLTFALFKTGAVIVLIDPGMGRKNIFRCLEEVRPDGFVAVNRVHLIRLLMHKRFPHARVNVSVGGWFPGVRATYAQLVASDAAAFTPQRVSATDPAAVIFTSGSTGPPKGVLYEHGMFDAQVELIQAHYGIEPGEIDLPGFPLFGLFNAAMGVTTVIPDMDPTRPAEVDPEKIIQAVRDQGVTQAFGSPAFWNRVGRHCVERGITLPSIRRALSAGGPVPTHVLEKMRQVLTHPEADLFTPYGATESLPVASIGAREVLDSTAAQTRQGKGTCVGHPFPGIDVRIIEITDGPITSLEQARALPAGEVGEIIVKGPSVTREYFQRPEATRLAKIAAKDSSFFHRIGDVGYLDETGRLWFCGRKAHIVEAEGERMYSVCCEAIFDEHPRIYRSALVGVGESPHQRPVIVVEPEPGEFPRDRQDEDHLRAELLELAERHAHTSQIQDILFHPSLPVDTRHNVKINREALAEWAGGALSVKRNSAPPSRP